MEASFSAPEPIEFGPHPTQREIDLAPARLRERTRPMLTRTTVVPPARRDTVLAATRNEQVGIDQAVDEPALTFRVAIPHAPEAERALLGCLLLAPTHLEAVRKVVQANDFYGEANAHVFEALCEIANRDESIDGVTLAEELRRRGRLHACGGYDALLALTDVLPIVEHVRSYTQLVRRRARQRRALDACARRMRRIAEG